VAFGDAMTLGGCLGGELTMLKSSRCDSVQGAVGPLSPPLLLPLFPLPLLLLLSWSRMEPRGGNTGQELYP
jgi:hypothetical protein